MNTNIGITLSSGETRNVDLSGTVPLPLAEMTLAAARDAFNLMCDVALALGLDPMKCTKTHRFADRVNAEKRVAALHSGIRAAVESRRAVAAEEARGGSPGARRLKNSGKSEDIRQNVLADQEKAKKMAKGEPKAKKEKVVREKKEPRVKAERKSRAPKDIYSDAATITLLHVGENPKRGLAAERFSHYCDGMTVADYVAAVHGGVNRPLAVADLRWDASKGWIKLNPPVEHAQAA